MANFNKLLTFPALLLGASTFLSSAIAADKANAANAEQKNDSRPNILFLLADDMGYGELGCYGQQIIQTPVLDQLAADGVRFTDFHAGNSVSSPSRAVIMTGISSGHNIVRGNQGRNIEDGGTRVALRKEDTTVAEMLRGVGYQTAFIGKWHVEDSNDLSTWAYNRGFEYAAQEQWNDKGDDADKYNHKENVEYINGRQDSLIYIPSEWNCKDEFRTQIALDYLDEQYVEDKPLFMFMSYRAPHAHEYVYGNKDLYEEKGWPENERWHAAKISLLDKQIGRLLDKLDTMGILDNTLIVFTSDNGPQCEAHDHEFFNSNGDLRGFKRDMFEGGTRVPCIMYWKGKITSGNVEDFMVGAQDLVPTFAEVSGAKKPKKSDGLSLVSLITENKDLKRDKLYWEIFDSGFSRQAVRMGDWKAVRYGINNDFRLYDLSTDISETKDLAAEKPEILNRMIPLFKSMRIENDHFPLGEENSFNRFCKTKVRKTSLFNDDWKFILDDNQHYRDVDFDDSKWQAVRVPHDWSIEQDYYPESPSTGKSGYFKEGLGWYRKTFTVSPDSKGRQHTVQFDGVFMNSSVWINGVFMGTRPYGYSTFQYDITEYLKYGEENVIAVRVDNSNPEATRWYNGSGIYRNVHMIETGYTHFRNNGGIYITTPVAEADKAIVNVDYSIVANYITEDELRNAETNKYNRDAETHVCEIRTIIYDKDGIELARTIEHKDIRSYNKKVSHTQQVEIKNPIRWSAENPYLYYMKSEIMYENKVLDDVVTPFGIRDIEYNSEKGLLVNGEQVKLRGVCLHHDGGSVGAAVPNDILIYRLGKLKEMGCNAIRTSHNPFSPDFYHVCDSMGFYVFDECFDEWKDSWKYNPTENERGKALNSYHHYFDQWAETDLRDMIKRDRNHPSVIMWGIGNEVPYFREDDAKDIAKWLQDICHDEDPTRPVSLGDNASHNTVFNGVVETMDIVGYNYIMRQHPNTLYQKDRELFPDKLFFASETGREIEYFLAYRDNDYVIGQFIWTGIDYLGETRAAPQRGFNSSLHDMCCDPRESGMMFNACWSSEPVVQLAVASNVGHVDSLIYKHGVTHIPVVNTEASYTFLKSWNWDADEHNYVKIYSNCEEMELKINGKSLGRHKNDFSKYHLTYQTPFVKGKLEAIGYNNGKVVTREVLYTAGEPTQIATNVVNAEVKAGSAGVTIIEATICDKDGIKVPTATNLVNVEVSDNLKLIGIDTRNLFFEGVFAQPTRNAAEGKLLIYVQEVKEKGEGKVTISSDGLTSAVVDVKIK